MNKYPRRPIPRLVLEWATQSDADAIEIGEAPTHTSYKLVKKAKPCIDYTRQPVIHVVPRWACIAAILWVVSIVISACVLVLDSWLGMAS